MRCAHWGWGVSALVALRAATALPAYDEQRTEQLDHVTVMATADADPAMVTVIGDLCDVAAGVYQQQCKLPAPATLRVCISPVKHWHPSVVSDRRSRVYVTYVPPERSPLRVSRSWDPWQPGPVHVLCRAVAELFNPHRVPGLEQLLASVYGVPAVLDKLADKAWVKPYEIDARDGRALFDAHVGQPAYLAVHPRWAAAAALDQVAERLKPEGLARCLAALKGEGRPALAMLRKLVAAQDPALADAFADYDRAVDLPLQPDGSLVLSSFEDAAQVALWPHPMEAKVAASTEWATDGKRCGAATFGAADYAALHVLEEDWRYQDWSAFSSLELDVRNPSDTAIRLACIVADDPSWGHGQVSRYLPLAANSVQHVVVPLLEAGLQGPYQGVYYDGRVRLDQVAELDLHCERRAGQPFTLQVDNVRLKP